MLDVLATTRVNQVQITMSLTLNLQVKLKQVKSWIHMLDEMDANKVLQCQKAQKLSMYCNCVESKSNTFM